MTAEEAQALVDAALERWPSLADTPGLAATVAEASAGEEASCLRPDFVLACTLAEGRDAAYRIFETEFVPPLRGALGRAGIQPDLVDDALQVVRFRLLVATDTSPAKIRSYRGRSSLGRWLYVVASREARALAGRLRNRATTDAGASDLQLAESATTRSGDLESRYFAQEHKPVFTRALAAAIATLTSKQRLLLRLDILEGLSDGEIANIYNVHRTTALRWVERATEELIAETKRLVSEELRLRDAELDSLMQGMASRFELSLGRLLAETPSPNSADAPASV